MSKETLDLYEQYQIDYPFFFTQNELLYLITDRKILEKYEKSENVDLGIVYHSKYYALSVDLIRSKKGRYYRYSRILQSKSEDKRPSVAVPVYRNRFVLIQQFRHPARKYYWEFPRGFNEHELRTEENVVKELFEELGAEPKGNPVYLGLVSPDTGLEDISAAVYAVEISKLTVNKGHEGIIDYKLVSEAEMIKMIRDNEITDGFTISAFSRYRISGNAKQDDYYFISYSRKDYEKVESIANVLMNNDFNIWFDKYIPLETEWEDVLIEKILNCSKILLMVSKESIARPMVAKEISLAKKYRKPIIPIFLDHTSLLRAKKEVRDFLTSQQQFMLPYLDHAHFEALKKALENAAGKDPFDSDDCVVRQTDYEYMYPAGNPQLNTIDDGSAYYMAEPQDVSDGIVSVCELDNQWFPDNLASQLSDSLESQNRNAIFEERSKAQATELFKALIHSRQLLINRASFWNSDVFVSAYTKENSKERAALKELVNNGSLILALYKETTPYIEVREEERIQVAKKDVNQYNRFIRECIPYCLRQDWVSNTFNNMHSTELLAMRFTDFCMTIFTNKGQIEHWIQKYNIQDKEAFYGRLREISAKVIQEQLTGTNYYYGRTAFYRDFVVKNYNDKKLQDQSILEAWIDPDKPYSAVLKRIADQKYCENFAYAFRCYLKEGNQYYRVSDSLKSDYSREFMKRSVSLGEIIFALEEFTHCRSIPASCYKVGVSRLTFRNLCTLRRSGAWEKYIDAVESIRERAYKWSIDFSEIIKVTALYSDVFKESGVKEEYSVSLRFGIGHNEITIIVKGRKRKPAFMFYAKQVMEEIDTVPLIIQFIANDASVKQNNSDAWIHFFHGVTAITGKEMFESILWHLRNDKSFTELDAPAINP